jgi:hypothetical protein
VFAANVGKVASGLGSACPRRFGAVNIGWLVGCVSLPRTIVSDVCLILLRPYTRFPELLIGTERMAGNIKLTSSVGLETYGLNPA